MIEMRNVFNYGLCLSLSALTSLVTVSYIFRRNVRSKLRVRDARCSFCSDFWWDVPFLFRTYDLCCLCSMAERWLGTEGFLQAVGRSLVDLPYVIAYSRIDLTHVE